MIGRTLSVIHSFEGPCLKLDSIKFHFSDFGLLHRVLVILPSNSLTISVSGGTISQPSKRPRLLQPGKISELIVDTDSDEARVSSDVHLVERGSENVPGVSQPQPYHKTASCLESSSFIQCL